MKFLFIANVFCVLELLQRVFDGAYALARLVEPSINLAARVVRG